MIRVKGSENAFYVTIISYWKPWDIPKCGWGYAHMSGINFDSWKISKKNRLQLIYDSTVLSKGKLSGSRSILKSIYFCQGVEKAGSLVAFSLVKLLI